MRQPALLALEDGSLFRGESIGVEGLSVGEVVFNTAMTGYQEILTDPSYCKQIVTLTYPHIGNVGCNLEDEESPEVRATGLIIRDLPPRVSNFRARYSLPEYLAMHRVVAIADIDTRRLTRLLREKGAQNGAIMAGQSQDPDVALAAARGFPGLKGMDLARVVSCTQEYPWIEGTWSLSHGHPTAPEESFRFRVVAYDYGVKHNILRMLVSRGCHVTVVPAETPPQAVLAMQPNGVFLSNGPGDPEPCEYAIAAARTFMERRVPLFGICLGHQILGLASGARTIKMKFGHHGANHPVQDIASGQVMITSQNHGFAVDESSLPANVTVTHRSLFDNSLQGIRCTNAPAFGFQGHPEASPGPHDVASLFDQFVEMMENHRPGTAP